MSNPNSPRPKKPPLLSEYWNKYHQFRIGDRIDRVGIGKTIRKAMDAGQQSAVVLRIFRKECILADMESMITTPRGGMYSKHVLNTPKLHQDLMPLLEFLKEQGLEWKIGSNVVGMSAFTSMHSPFADFIVYWQPSLEPSPQGTLLSYWLTSCTIKWPDATLSQKWYTTCQRAMQAGQKHAILCTLYHETDFKYTHHGFENTSIREALSLQPLSGDIEFCSNAFEPLLQWIQEQKLQWCILLEATNKFEWAYLTAIWEM